MRLVYVTRAVRLPTLAPMAREARGDAAAARCFARRGAFRSIGPTDLDQLGAGAHRPGAIVYLRSRSDHERMGAKHPSAHRIKSHRNYTVGANRAHPRCPQAHRPALGERPDSNRSDEDGRPKLYRGARECAGSSVSAASVRSAQAVRAKCIASSVARPKGTIRRCCRPPADRMPAWRTCAACAGAGR